MNAHIQILVEKELVLIRMVVLHVNVRQDTDQDQIKSVKVIGWLVYFFPLYAS